MNTVTFNNYFVNDLDFKIKVFSEAAGKETGKLLRDGENPDYHEIIKKWIPEYKTHDEILAEGFRLYTQEYVAETNGRYSYDKYLTFLTENGCDLTTLEFKNTLTEAEVVSPQQQYDQLYTSFSTASTTNLNKDRSALGYVKRAGAFVKKTFTGFFSGIMKAFGDLKGLVKNIHKRLSVDLGSPITSGLVITIAALLISTSPIWLPSIASTVVFGAVFGFIGKKIGESVGNEIVKAHGGSKFAKNVGGFIGKIVGAATGAGAGKLLSGVVHNQGILLIGKICTLSPQLDSIFGKLFGFDGKTLGLGGNIDQVTTQVKTASATVKPDALNSVVDQANQSAAKAGGQATKGMTDLAAGKPPAMDAGGPGPIMDPNDPNYDPTFGKVDPNLEQSDGIWNGVSGEDAATSNVASVASPVQLPQETVSNILQQTKDMAVNSTDMKLLDQPLTPNSLRTLAANLYNPDNLKPYNDLLKAAGDDLVKKAFGHTI